ncbi:GGDEF domain-containing protein [Neobacillus niacini]|uniref:GGDEF domain-containing protein n=1 Tax=Neobacillus niacini TaxID=86668 RepID=UPI0039833CED
MKYKGRIITFLIVLFINLLYTSYYFIRDGYIGWIEYIGCPILLMLAWWFGKQYDKARYYSEKDPLTGIYNRRYVETAFATIKPRVEQNGQSGAVLLLDVNDFKLVNDHLGHKLGDEYLIMITNQLKRSVRKTDIVARWGGDEFLILSPDIKRKVDLDKMIERIHQNLNQLSFHDVKISVSIGSALFPKYGKELDELLKVADQNMYQLKSQKKLRDTLG